MRFIRFGWFPRFTVLVFVGSLLYVGAVHVRNWVLRSRSVAPSSSVVKHPPSNVHVDDDKHLR